MIGTLLSFAVIILVIVLIVRAVNNHNYEPDGANVKYVQQEKKVFERERHPISLNPYFLSRDEYKLYKVLYEILHENTKYDLVSKTRWEDIWKAQKGQNNMRYRGFLRSRHVDFLLIGTEQGCPIKMIIELNDRSHKRKDRQERDQRLKHFCEDTGIHLLIINSRDSYDVEVIKSKLNKCMNSKEVVCKYL